MAKVKSITLKGDEAASYQSLCDWAGGAGASRFVLAVIGSRPVITSQANPQKWFVPSSSQAGEYHVADIELRVCDCAGWMFKHRCSHLAVADRAAQLRFRMFYGGPDQNGKINQQELSSTSISRPAIPAAWPSSR